MGLSIAELPNVDEKQHIKHTKPMEKEKEIWAKKLEIKAHC